MRLSSVKGTCIRAYVRACVCVCCVRVCRGVGERSTREMTPLVGGGGGGWGLPKEIFLIQKIVMHFEVIFFLRNQVYFLQAFLLF